MKTHPAYEYHSYPCPKCEADVEVWHYMDPEEELVMCWDCGETLALDVDADCDADGYFDCSHLYVPKNTEAKP